MCKPGYTFELIFVINKMAYIILNWLTYLTLLHVTFYGSSGTTCAHKLCIHSFDIMQLLYIVKHAGKVLYVFIHVFKWFETSQTVWLQEYDALYPCWYQRNCIYNWVLIECKMNLNQSHSFLIFAIDSRSHFLNMLLNYNIYK